MTHPEQVEAAFATIEQAWGPVEVLVANAGVTRDTLALRMTEDGLLAVRLRQAGPHPPPSAGMRTIFKP